MKKILIPLALGSLLLSGRLVAAESFIDYGRVLHADPVYKTVKVYKPHTECRVERRHKNRDSRRDRHRHNSAAPLAGAIIGGVVGHQIGHGTTRDIATIAGSIVGAAVASEHSENHFRHGQAENRHRHRRHRVEHCKSVDRVHKKRVLDGYDVTYRYKGEIFHTFSSTYPGKRIRLKVTIRPQVH